MVTLYFMRLPHKLFGYLSNVYGHFKQVMFLHFYGIPHGSKYKICYLIRLCFDLFCTSQDVHDVFVHFIDYMMLVILNVKMRYINEPVISG